MKISKITTKVDFIENPTPIYGNRYRKKGLKIKIILEQSEPLTLSQLSQITEFIENL